MSRENKAPLTSETIARLQAWDALGACPGLPVLKSFLATEIDDFELRIARDLEPGDVPGARQAVVRFRAVLTELENKISQARKSLTPEPTTPT